MNCDKICIIFFVLSWILPGQAQDTRLAANVIMPQTRAFAMAHRDAVDITKVEVRINILEQLATVAMEISLYNPTGSRLEAELIVPVPGGAVVKGFTFQGQSTATAQLLPKHEARRIYDAIVAQVRDPALLEFIGYNLIRSSVFPVEAKSSQIVRLTYEQLLSADGNRVDFVLPRSESMLYRIPWEIAGRIRSPRPIATVYSPSHKLDFRHVDAHEVRIHVTSESMAEPGPLRLSYLHEENAVTSSLFTYPDPKAKGGYFLLLSGFPSQPPLSGDGAAMKREVTLVLDRSGSMRGEKMEQVRAASLQILESLEEGESFNIVTYNHVVESFAPQGGIPNTRGNLEKARSFLHNIFPSGGTNIHEALLESLRFKPRDGMLPIVLFLTDGLPTIGETSEPALCRVVAKSNPYERRIFTFGVGVDVNTPLLEKMALLTRATATFVLPQEDVQAKVAQVFRRLSGPILANPRLDIYDTGGNKALGRVQDVIPNVLPDVFAGDQLVILGKYLGDAPLVFELSGNFLGKQKKFRSTFNLDKASTLNSFVPRLWASRQIAMLVDAIRQMGAGTGTWPDETPSDPRLRELVDEVVRLSTEFGILTEYTAFLAREGTDLSNRARILSEANKNFRERALNCRSGLGSVNQEINVQAQMQQNQLNSRNNFWDANMNRVTITAVQQISDRAFYRRNDRWVDSRLLSQEQSLRPPRIISFGSDAFWQLAERLATEGRQGFISQAEDVLVMVDGEPVLIRGMGKK